MVNLRNKFMNPNHIDLQSNWTDFINFWQDFLSIKNLARNLWHFITVIKFSSTGSCGIPIWETFFVNWKVNLCLARIFIFGERKPKPKPFENVLHDI